MPGIVIDTILGAARSGLATELRNDHNKGWFIDALALRAAYPAANAGDFATVGGNTGGPSIWVWDQYILDWEDSASSGLVTSVFGRVGDVTAQAGDYAAFYETIGTMVTHLGAFVHGDIALNTGARHTQGTDLGLDTGGLNAVTAATIVGHIGSVANPHSVTYAQAGADAAGTAAGLMAAHLGAFVHGDIAANTSARHARLHALNDALDHSGNLAASQLPLGGSWALTSSLTINSGAAAVDFIINRKTSGTALKYDQANDCLTGDFIKYIDTNKVSIGFDANPGVGNNQVCIGYQAGKNKTDGSAVLVGYQAGLNLTTGSTAVVAVGYGAMSVGTTSCWSGTAVGYLAAQRMTGFRNTAVGASAMRGTTGVSGVTNCVAVGSDCLVNIDTGATGLVALGTFAGNIHTSGQYCLYLGHGAGRYETTNSGRLHIDGRGYGRAGLADSEANAIIYGVMTAAGRTTQTLSLNAAVTVARGLTVNNDAAAVDFIIKRVTSGTAFKYNGTTDAIEGDFVKLSGTNSILGLSAGNATMSGGADNVLVHGGAGSSITTGSSNICVGSYAGNKLTSAGSNVFIGASAGRFQTGIRSVAIGSSALSCADGYGTGNYNVAIGYNALNGNDVTQCVAIGYGAGGINSAALNVFIGYDCGGQNTTSGSIVYIGQQCGRQMRGQQNTVVGAEALLGGNTPANNTGSYNTVVGRYAVSNSNDMTANLITAIGYQAAKNQYNVDRGICLGAYAGMYETVANKLFIDSYDRSTEAGSRTNSIIYGIMASAGAASQTITFNVASEIIPSASARYYGDPSTDGTWRTVRSGDNLLIERRESGSYVTKHYAGASEYDTVYLGAAALTPATTNGAVAATLETTTHKRNYDVLDFKGTDNDTIAWAAFQMPEDWDLGTFKVEIVWEPETGASADDWLRFEVSAGVCRNDDAIDAAMGSAVNVDDQVIAVGDEHISPVSAAITPSGTASAKCMMYLKINRDYDYAGGGAALAEKARLKSIRVQYKKSGSVISGW